MGSAHHRGLKSSWGWVWIFPKKDRGVGNLSTLQSHHFSCSWKARLYCVAASFVFTKEVKEQSRAAITRPVQQQWDWGMNLLLALSHGVVPSAPRTRESMNVCTHTLLREGSDPSLCLLLPAWSSLFKQLLPGELGLACSQCLGGDLSCGCCCMDCVFDKDKAVMASSPQPAFPTPNKKLVFLRRNTSGEILYYCILHREYSAMTQIVAFCNIFLIKQ